MQGTILFSFLVGETNRVLLNSFFETTNSFTAYSIEHWILLISFFLFVVMFIRSVGKKLEEEQRKILLSIAIILTVAQLAKIPLNLYTGIFEVTRDVPLHMCNFLPFIMIWVYATKSRVVWATTFFWVILGVSQANFTPSVEYSLFYYDAIRYWLVHLFPILLALYPAIVWKWTLELKDVLRTVLALNGVVIVIYLINLVLGSNYLYIMEKPPGTTFFSILPPWPTYILVLEVIIVVWSLMLWGVFWVIGKVRGSEEKLS